MKYMLEPIQAKCLCSSSPKRLKVYMYLFHRAVFGPFHSFVGFIHSTFKYLFSTYYMLYTVLGAGNIVKDKAWSLYSNRERGIIIWLCNVVLGSDQGFKHKYSKVSGFLKIWQLGKVSLRGHLSRGLNKMKERAKEFWRRRFGHKEHQVQRSLVGRFLVQSTRPGIWLVGFMWGESSDEVEVVAKY